MKKCSSCKKIKSLGDFNKNKSKKDGLNTICRLCSKKRSKKYYEDNREKHLVEVRKHRKRQRFKLRKYVWSYKQAHPCISCGEQDPRVLEFSHINKKSKYMNVAHMVGQAVSITRLNKEIDKCEILCANCHRRKTFIQESWFVGE
jgi:5-methylcytosine-specific restriction endonuclease McrA